jgi:hypothetical protein
MATSRWADDYRLLAALRGADREAAVVPRELIEAAKATFTWHDPDTEATLFLGTLSGAAVSRSRWR